MTLTEKSGHLAWCALMALALANKLNYLWSTITENDCTVNPQTQLPPEHLGKGIAVLDTEKMTHKIVSRLIKMVH